MTGKEIRDMVNNGMKVIVEFNSHVQELDGRFERGMRAYIVKVGEEDYDGIKFFFEEKNFADFNKSLETVGWYNNVTGEYDLKYSEKHLNHKGTDDFFDELDEEIINFKVINNEHGLKLYNKYVDYYVKSKSDVSYVTWLENLVNELENKNG